jgi:hypothetical protein
MKQNKCAPAAHDQPLRKHRRFITVQPDRPPPAGRRSPHVYDAGPRAARSGRDGARDTAIGDWRLLLAKGGNGRSAFSLGQPAGRCASRLKAMLPGSWWSGAERRPAERRCPRAGAEPTIAPAHRWFAGGNSPLSRPAQGSHQVHVRCQRKGDFYSAEIVLDSCPKFMSDKRGLGGFRVQLRHANAWRVVRGNCQARTPQGSRCEAARGQPISNHIEVHQNRYHPNQKPNLYGADDDNGES